MGVGGGEGRGRSTQGIRVWDFSMRRTRSVLKGLLATDSAPSETSLGAATRRRRRRRRRRGVNETKGGGGGNQLW